MTSPSVDDSALREAIQRATLHEPVRQFAQRAGVNHETVYAFLRGKAVTDRMQRRMAEALRAAPPTTGEPASTESTEAAGGGSADATGPVVEVPLALLAYWRGRVEEQIRTISGVSQTISGVNTTVGGIGDSLRALQGMLEQATGGMTEFMDSGVLTPANSGGWQLMPPPDAETMARVKAELEARQRAARSAETAPPAQQRRRAGGDRR